MSSNSDFDGADYQPDRDRRRLRGQIKRIFDLMKDGRYRSLDEIASITGDPHASVSAQLRNMRKPKFGGHIVNRRYINNGLYQYQLVANGGV